MSHIKNFFKRLLAEFRTTPPSCLKNQNFYPALPQCNIIIALI